MAAFATVLTVAAPFMQNDELKARMKLVSAEREMLRATSATARRQRDAAARQQAGRSAHADRGHAELAEGLRGGILAGSPAAGGSSQRERTWSAIWLSGWPAPLFWRFLPTSIHPRSSRTRCRFYAACSSPCARRCLDITCPDPRQESRARRQTSIQKAWSDALDLMLICVESGMAIEPALQRVARRSVRLRFRWQKN